MKRFSRFSIIFLSLLLLFTLFAAVVYAQNYDISNAFGEVAKVINSIAKAFRSTAVIEGFVRFAFWVFIFAGISAANSKVENKMVQRTIHVLAAILATYGAFRVPSKLIIGLFNFPYAVIVILWGLVVPIAGFLLTKKIFPDEEKRSHRFGRAVLFLLMVLLMFNIMDVIQKSAGPDTAVFMRMLWPVRIGAAIALLFGLVNLAMALGGDKAVEALGEKLGIKKKEEEGAPGAAPHGAGAAAHAPPPPNPAEITKLQNEIGNFVSAIGNPSVAAGPAGPGTGAAGLFAVLEGAIAKYNTEIHGAANDAARRTAAPTHMAALNTLQTELGNQRKRMGDILHNDQYLNCGEPYRRAFEGAIAQFLRIENNFTQMFYQTIRWL